MAAHRPVVAVHFASLSRAPSLILFGVLATGDIVGALDTGIAFRCRNLEATCLAQMTWFVLAGEIAYDDVTRGMRQDESIRVARTASQQQIISLTTRSSIALGPDRGFISIDCGMARGSIGQDS